jgi:hypothetical protein
MRPLPSLGLGTSESFAILAGTTVNSTGVSTVSGDIGTSPGTTVAGFPPGQVKNGSSTPPTPPPSRHRRI